MLRRPEPIEIVLNGICLLCLVVSALDFHIRSGTLDIDYPLVVYIIITALFLCIILETIFERMSLRYSLLAAHFFLVVWLVEALEGQLIMVEIVSVAILMVQINLRLSFAYGVLFDSIIIAITFLYGYHRGGVLYDRILIASIETLVGLTSSFSFNYREKLVEVSRTLKDQQQSLVNLHAAAQSFVEHLESVEADSAERERFRITRELHDTIGYSMTNVAMMMNASRHLLSEDPEKLLEYCRKTKSLASETMRETRQILYRLRDTKKQSQQNLPVFFGRLCWDFKEATGVKTECHPGNLPDSMSERVVNILFRTAQVAFINALRHGNAGHIKLFFWLDDLELRMTIWNNMQENMPESITENEGIGLKGVRERLESVNGQLALTRVVDGFRLEVIIPREVLNIEADISAHSG